MDMEQQLLIQSGPLAGYTFELTRDSLTIGRYPLADIVLDDPEVAYRHAVLTRREGAYWIADLGSDEGTYLNGRRVGADPVPLAHGDIVSFGPRLTAAFLHGPVVAAAEEEDEPEAAELFTAAFNARAGEDTFFDEEAYNAIEEAVPGAAEDESVQDEPGEPPHWTQAPISHDEPLPPIPPIRKYNTRNVLIAVGCVAFLTACCCTSTLFMYFIGGDWLLSQMGYLP